ncbi:hypothetical protein E4634_11880 [Mangrovimicrobium sediminis]|uniref:PEP-CTERM sorting domain-containing protein n=1 Tax=Mangrovimicrobium sediminis TaxID=2562682 RepID=A0A4Z0M0D1_9GAMM|nr:hypothetical protein [Haliea sp. SAOS-164]TGD72979.1 hypothetical protein E4634_11880 [Haliea sp. SAOS-164]
MQTRNTLLALGLLCAALPASAAVQQHNFTASGPGGITGSGYFTYDDSVVPNGDPVANNGDGPGDIDNTINYAFTLSGGIAGTGVTFTKATCGSAPALFNAPDFTVDINFFNCVNGSFSGNGEDFFTFEFSDGVTSTVSVTFAPGATVAGEPADVPALPFAALGLLAGLLGWTGYRRLKA